MYLVPDRGVAQHERQDIFLGDRTDRDAARVFLQVVCRVEAAGQARLHFAADRLELWINVVRQRIDEFVQQIGVTLSAHNARGMMGKWYRSISSDESSATFGLRITPVAAGFRGCFK
jgi:hypothetical protein